MKNKRAIKYDSGKPALALIPKQAMYMCGQALAYGASKYGDHNFKLGMLNSRMVAAALRHIYQYLDGQDVDDESGLPHISHALASLAMLAYNMEKWPEMDDRFKHKRPKPKKKKMKRGKNV